MKSFKGKLAVVTGGASGIGRGCALAFAREGASVAILDLHEARAQETAEEAAKHGVGALALRCDVSSDSDITNARRAVLDRFGRADLLMNNAGVLPVGAFENIPLPEWERVFQINFLSVVRCTQAFLPDLEASGDGHLVNTASVAGLIGYDPFTLAYSASKAAVISLSEGLAAYLRPRNVGVTCLCPGPVATNIGEHVRMFGEAPHLGAYASRNFKMRSPDEVGGLVVAAVLSNRFLAPSNDEVFDELRERARDPEVFIGKIVTFLDERRQA